MQFDRLVREREVLAITGYTRSSFRRALSKGEFPKGFKRGRTRLWSTVEIQGWIAREMSEARAAEPMECA